MSIYYTPPVLSADGESADAADINEINAATETAFDLLEAATDEPLNAILGPSSSLDNAIVTFNGTTGKLAQSSLLSITDAGSIQGIGTSAGTVQLGGIDATGAGHQDIITYGKNVSSSGTYIHHKMLLYQTTGSGSARQEALRIDFNDNQSAGSGGQYFINCVGGWTLDISGNVIQQGNLYFNDANTLIFEDGSHNLSFTDAVTGTKTLAQLAAAGAGDVVGPASATDTAIATFDGTTGKLLKNNSGVTIDASNRISAGAFLGPLDGTVTQAAQTQITSLGTLTILNVDNLRLDGNTIISSDTNGDINITPDGTGDLILDGLKWPQADGTVNYVLQTNGSAQLQWAEMTSGFTDPMTTRGDLIYKNAGGTTTRLAAGANTYVLTSDGTDISWAAQTGGTPTDITVADESADTTCFVGFFTEATGDLGPKTGTNLTFNSNTGMLTATGFTGPLTGQADTVATIAGLAPNTATTQATQPNITTCDGLVSIQTHTVTLTGDLVRVGAHNLTLTTSAITNATFPAGTKTLVATDVATLSSLTSVGTLTVLNVDNLRLDGNTIISTDSAGDINITPDTTGDLVLDGLKWPQADGTANYVLETDGAGQLSWVAQSGAFTEDGNGLITATNAPVLLDEATGNEVAMTLQYTTNKASSGNDTGLLVAMTDTASPGTSLLIDAQVGGTSKFKVDNSGRAYFDSGSLGGVFSNASAASGIAEFSDALLLIANDVTALVVSSTTISPGAGISYIVGESEIRLDHDLSADEKFSGISYLGNVGYSATVGDLVYMASADGRWELADATAAATSGPVMLGIVMETTADTGQCAILLQGTARSAAFGSLATEGAPVYVGETAGDPTQTAPSDTGDVVRVIGHLIDATTDTIYFNPSGDWVEVA